MCIRPLARLHLKRRAKRGKEDPKRLSERYGISTSKRPSGKVVWFHAVGVGEVLTIPSIISAMLELDPSLLFLITSSARNAARALDANMPPNTVHQFVPLDAAPYIDRFLDHWTPSLSVWVEQEIFPNLIDRTHRRKIPLALINARMDLESRNRKQFFRRSFSYIFECFDFIQSQNTETTQNLISLGVPDGTITNEPTLKSGALPLADWPEQRKLWTEKFSESRLWCAASVHLEEAEILLSALQKIRKTKPNSVLILVPRNPEEGSKFQAACDAYNLPSCLVSKQALGAEPMAVLIADTMGQLGLWYRMCDIAFIGGSLCDVNGHNPYEATALGCAVVHGPKIANFADSYTQYQAAHAAIEVINSDDLAAAILIDDHSAMVANAHKIIESGRENISSTAKQLYDLVT
jgi:3-deoxy-D-manno-octulosonic-acid transferase